MKQRLASYIFILFSAIMAAHAAYAVPADSVATMNPVMQRYYAGCRMLLDGISLRSESMLADAAALLDESKDNPDRITLCNLPLIYTAEPDTAAMKGHVVFSGEYALHCMRDVEDTFIPKATAMRGAGDGDCFVYSDAVSAGGVIEYMVMMSGDCQLLVVAEKGAQLDVSVADGTVRPASVYEDGSEAFLSWRHGDKSLVRIRIGNKAAKDIGYVLITN